MTHEEIINGNKIIAEWISGGVATDGHPQGSKNWSVHLPRDFCDKISIRYHPYNPVLFVFEHELYFHSSYDWIMGVVDMIRQTKIPGRYGVCFHIHNDMAYFDIDNIAEDGLTRHMEPTLVESIRSACIEFINWYNKNNK